MIHPLNSFQRRRLAKVRKTNEEKKLEEEARTERVNRHRVKEAVRDQESEDALKEWLGKNSGSVVEV